MIRIVRQTLTFLLLTGLVSWVAGLLSLMTHLKDARDNEWDTYSLDKDGE